MEFSEVLQHLCVLTAVCSPSSLILWKRKPFHLPILINCTSRKLLFKIRQAFSKIVLLHKESSLMMKVRQSPMLKHCVVFFFMYCNLLIFHHVQGKDFTFHLDFKHFSVLCINNEEIIILKYHPVSIFQQLANTQKVLVNFRNI